VGKHYAGRGLRTGAPRLRSSYRPEAWWLGRTSIARRRFSCCDPSCCHPFIDNGGPRGLSLNLS
jgi:hypothetical protein